MSDNRRVIHAEPTKELFIYMLVRDIPLIRAIIDLVDNSVDGATHLQSNENYEGLWIKILVNKEYFQIQDNCGGITVKEAEEYAFKFGRANDATVTPKSIGRFGIGMKRAFFKIGQKFKVESTTSSSKFVISEDVQEWKKKDEWTFEFLEVQEGGDYKSSEIGTQISIEKLHESVSEDLGLENFLSQLKQELTIAYSLKLKKGLNISINNEVLRPTPLTFRTSDNIKVAKFEKEYNYFGSREIDTQCGLGCMRVYQIEILMKVDGMYSAMNAWFLKLTKLKQQAGVQKMAIQNIMLILHSLEAMLSWSLMMLLICLGQRRKQGLTTTHQSTNQLNKKYIN